MPRPSLEPMSLVERLRNPAYTRDGKEIDISFTVADMAAAADEIERLRLVLEFIANLEPGSRAAYSKFAGARRRAVEALNP